MVDQCSSVSTVKRALSNSSFALSVRGEVVFREVDAKRWEELGMVWRCEGVERRKFVGHTRTPMFQPMGSRLASKHVHPTGTLPALRQTVCLKIECWRYLAPSLHF